MSGYAFIRSCSNYAEYMCYLLVKDEISIDEFCDYYVHIKYHTNAGPCTCKRKLDRRKELLMRIALKQEKQYYLEAFLDPDALKSLP